MTTHTHGVHTVRRYCDIAIIGGSAAGLAAALHLGRQGRSVIVVTSTAVVGDDMSTRVDGDKPSEALNAAAHEVRAHGVEVLLGRAGDVSAIDGAFRVELVGGHSLIARRVLTPADVAGMDLTGMELTGLGTALDAEPGPSANEADWDHRYSGEQMWSGNPNGSLVTEVSGLTAGRALDVGAGEGGDAIWLAEQGWQVTASDVSRRSLTRIDAEARRRGLSINLLHANANATHAFGDQTFDLVTAHYASIPRTAANTAVENLLNTVAPGGQLLVVGHDLEPMRGQIDTHIESRAFDPDAYVSVDHVRAAITTGGLDDGSWTIETDEKRARAAGAASHHVDDVILRARRGAYPKVNE